MVANGVNGPNKQDLVIIVAAVSAYLEGQTNVAHLIPLPKYKLTKAPIKRKVSWKRSFHPYFLTSAKTQGYIKGLSSWS